MASSSLQMHPLYIEDTLNVIFSYLSSHTNLAKVSLVCQIWNRVANAPNLWQDLLEHKSTKHRFTEDFNPLVITGFMRWKEAFRWSSLASFLSRIEELRFGEDSNRHPHMYLSSVTYGNTTFSIFNSCDIKVQRKRTATFEVLIGEKGKYLIQLAVDRNFLFALRGDGYIIQYDLKTNLKTAEIPTAWTLGKIALKRPDSVFRHKFHVEQGYIIIRYGTNMDDVFETIPYENLDRRYEGRDKEVPFPRRIIVHQEKLYILGRNRLFIWSLSTNKKLCSLPFDMDPSLFIHDITMDGNIVCGVDQNTLYVIDLERRLGWKKNDPIYKNDLLIVARVGNLFFTQQMVCLNGDGPQVRRRDDIVVIDLNTGQILERVEDILSGRVIKPEIIRRLIDICRLHEKKWTLPTLLPIKNVNDSNTRRSFIWLAGAFLAAGLAILVYQRYKK